MDIKRSEEAIRRLDEAYFRRRAEGFAELDELRDFSEIEEPIKSLLIEAYYCYTYIFYAGCILLSATALELTLKTMLSGENSEYSKHNLSCLIELAKERGIITKQQATQGHEIRKFRNVYVHYDVERLGKMAGNENIPIVPEEGEDMWVMKEMVKQFQLEEATRKHALKCVTKSYELIKDMYVRKGKAGK